MGKYEAVIFDLDGTLLNTLEDLADSVNVALANYHYPEKTLDQIRSYVGNGIQKLIERCLDRGRENPDFDLIYEAFRNHYKENCCNKTKPYDGIIDLLCRLKKQKIKMAIVSNKADFAVKELNQFFFRDFLMTAIGEQKGIAKKPEPDMVYQALQELSVPVEHAVYVGDSDVDVKTARRAKIPCISVLWGFRSREFLTQAGATCFAATADELFAILSED